MAVSVGCEQQAVETDSLEAEDRGSEAGVGWGAQITAEFSNPWAD
jgi:hypothetical protein